MGRSSVNRLSHDPPVPIRVIDRGGWAGPAVVVVGFLSAAWGCGVSSADGVDATLVAAGALAVAMCVAAFSDRVGSGRFAALSMLIAAGWIPGLYPFTVIGLL